MNEFFTLLLPWPARAFNLITDIFVYGILLFFFLCLGIFLRKTIRRSRLINSLAKQVNQHDRPAKPEVLPKLKESFDRNIEFAEAWQEFENSLITRQREHHGIQEDIVYKTDEASLFFSEDRLLEQRLNLRFWSSVPALLVGVGILGTFVGLVWGLIPFSGIDFEQTSKIQEAIKNLLSGVSTAFVTSVWGMLTSLLFNGLEKWGVGSMSGTLRDLQSGLDKLFTLTMVEEIAFRQEDELTQQTAALKSFSTDLADKIKIAMDDVMSKSRNQNSKDSEKIIQELHNVPDAISKAVVNQLEPNLNSLNTAAEELQKQSEQLDALHQGLKESHTQNTKDSQEIIQELHNVPNVLSKTMTEQLANLSSLNTAAEELQKQSEKLDALHQNLKESHTQNTKDNQEIIRELLNAPEAVGKTLEPSLNLLNAAIGNLNTTVIESVNEIKSGIGLERQEIIQEFQNTLDTINKTIQPIFNHLSTGVDNLNTTITESKNDIQNEMAQGRQEMISELQNIHHVLNNAMAEELIPTLNNLTIIVRDTQSLIEQGRKEIVQELHKLDEPMAHIETLAEKVGRASEDLVNLPDHVAQIAEDMQELLESAAHQTDERFNQRLAEMDAFFLRAAQTLQDIQQSAGTLLELQNEQIEAINSQLTNSRATLERGHNMLKEMNASIKSAQQITETMQIVSLKLTEGAEKIESTGQQLNRAGIAFNEGNQKALIVIRETADQIQGTLNQSHQLLNNFTQGFQQISNRLDQHLQEFQTISEELNGIFAEIERGLNTYADITRESIDKYLTDLSEQLAKASLALTRNAGILRDSVEKLTEMNENQLIAMVDSVEILKGSIVKLEDTSEHPTKQMENKNAKKS